MQHDDKPLRELDSTQASAANDRFEEIISRVKAAGAEITLDEESPLYADVANTESEIGRRRVVEFNIAATRTDYQITRDEKNKRITGTGYHAALQDLPVPQVVLKLKSKPELSQQWVSVDIEDLF